MVTTGAAATARGSARRRRCDLERDGERRLGRRLLFKRAGGLGVAARRRGVGGADSDGGGRDRRELERGRIECG